MDIIKGLLESYGLQPDEKTVSVVNSLIEIGFDNKWLNHMKIIKDFDELYKKQLSASTIYLELGDRYILHPDSIRRIVSNRKKYEI